MNHLNINKKISIILIFLILFNLIIPTYSHADFGNALADLSTKLVNPIKGFVLFLADGVYSIIQQSITGDGEITKKTGSGTFSCIEYTPDKIFTNKYPIFNVNFFNATKPLESPAPHKYTVRVYHNRKETKLPKASWQCAVDSISDILLLINHYHDCVDNIFKKKINEVQTQEDAYKIANEIIETYTNAPKGSALYNALESLDSRTTPIYTNPTYTSQQPSSYIIQNAITEYLNLAPDVQLRKKYHNQWWDQDSRRRLD